MGCAEWYRLMDRYCALLRTYSDAVVELKDVQGTAFDQRREHADVLRVIAQQARIEWEDHEKIHGCGRKRSVDS
jgi:hypothetical protein